MAAYGSHLYRREGTYYFRLSIPMDVREMFGNSELRRSLSTGNKTRAQARARRAAFELRNLFLQLDRANMPKKPTQQEIKRIVDDLFRTILDKSEFRLATSPPVDFSAVCRTREELEQEIGHTQLHLSLGHHGVAEADARKVAAKYDLDAPDESPEFKLLCRAMLRMKLDYLNVDYARRIGDYSLERQLLPPVAIQSPEVAPIPKHLKASTVALSVGVAKYVEIHSRKWSAKTKEKLEPLALEFIELVGDKPLSNLTRGDMREYSKVVHLLPKNRGRSKLYKGKSINQLIAMTIPASDLLSPGTVDDRFVSICALLNWLNDEYPMTLPHLAQLKKELEVERKATTEKRRAYTDDELRLLFAPEVYTSKKINKAWKYWLPLLGLLTGARLGELSQLRLADIKQDVDSGVWYMDINDEEQGKHLKTDAATRLVPLHPALIELGLLKHVSMLRKKKETQLFPTLFLYADPSQPGKYPSKWFSDFRQSRGLGGGPGEVSPLTYHSLRHTFITKCKLQKLDRSMVKELVGHEQGEFDDVTAGYEGKYPVKMRYDEVISRLDLSDVLDLGKLKATTWQGVV